jgi:methionine salvage enolase-phosphatase E1
MLKNVIIEFYDIYGRINITTKIDNSDSIDISSLMAGYYIIKLIRKNSDSTYIKMVKP